MGARLAAATGASPVAAEGGRRPPGRPPGRPLADMSPAFPPQPPPRLPLPPSAGPKTKKAAAPHPPYGGPGELKK